MLTKEQLRQNAWEAQRAAKTLRDKKHWKMAGYTCGYAVEFMLKARICVDHNLAGFPETRAELKAAKANGLDLWQHDFETLLNMTTLAAHVKHVCLNEWTTCLQWNPEMRYQPMATATEASANEMIRSAVAVIRRIAEIPGLEAYDVGQLAGSDNPYLKLVPVERELSDEHGNFSLFGVWHRANSFLDSSDVVVSAPWIDADSRKGVEYVANAIQRTLLGAEIKRVSGVFALDYDNPILRQLRSIYNQTDGWSDIHNCTFGGVEIEHAMIIRCQDV